MSRGLLREHALDLQRELIAEHRSVEARGALLHLLWHSNRPGSVREMGAAFMSNNIGVSAYHVEDMTRCDENGKPGHSGAHRRGKDESY